MSWLLRDGDVLAAVEDRRRGLAGVACRAPWCCGGPALVQTLTRGPARPLDVAWCATGRRCDDGRPAPARCAGSRSSAPRRVAAPHLGARRRWWWPRPGRSSAGACRSATASRSAGSDRAGATSRVGRLVWWAPRSATWATCRPRAVGGPGRRRRHLLRGHPADPEAAQRGRDPGAPPGAPCTSTTRRPRRPTPLSWQRRGRRSAVVTDAGMPGISDPGERVVRAGGRAGVAVEVVPVRRRGRPRWSLSGLPADRVLLRRVPAPAGTATRASVLRQHRRTRRATSVLYEAPHRVAAHRRRPGRRLRARPRRGRRRAS